MTEDQLNAAQHAVLATLAMLTQPAACGPSRVPPRRSAALTVLFAGPFAGVPTGPLCREEAVGGRGSGRAAITLTSSPA